MTGSAADRGRKLPRLPMHNGIHFISGLPRSGSTLLSALLLQNPALHAGITSPVGSLVGAVLREVSQLNEAAVMIDDGQRRALLTGLFSAYYGAEHESRTVFDTNRGWCARLHLIATLFPNAKVICCVRDLPWILDSIERMIRKNPMQLSRIFDFDPTGTVYSRIDGLTGKNGMVGYAYNALKQAMHSPEADRLLLLTYETLTREPDYAMQAVYEFVGLPPFKHDFKKISFDAAAFDARLGTPGLHTVEPVVRFIERQPILPPDLWRRFEGDSFWRDSSFNQRGVRVV
jgi:sulfotransferase